MSDKKNWPLRILALSVAFVLAAVFAVFLWYVFAYVGMTLIIPLDYVARGVSFAALGPAVCWLIVGCVVGTLFGCVRGLYRFRGKNEATGTAILAGFFILLLYAGAFMLTAQRQVRERGRVAAAELERVESAARAAREAVEKERLDKAWQEGKLWQAVRFENRLSTKVTFDILDAKGNWKSQNLKPGGQLTYWDKVREITVKFDYDYTSNNKFRQLIVSSTPSVGREPASSVANSATLHYFEVTNNIIYLR